MKFLKKICICFIFSFTTVFLTAQGENNSSVKWWNNAWQYRRALLITNSDTTVHESELIRIPFEDFFSIKCARKNLRIVDDKNQIVQFEIQSQNKPGWDFPFQAGDWINFKANRIPAQQVIRYYLYYGNDEAPIPKYEKIWNMVYENNFDTAGELGSEWKIESGTWEIKNGALVGKYSGWDNGLLLTKVKAPFVLSFKTAILKSKVKEKTNQIFAGGGLSDGNKGGNKWMFLLTAQGPGTLLKSRNNIQPICVFEGKNNAQRVRLGKVPNKIGEFVPFELLMTSACLKITAGSTTGSVVPKHAYGNPQLIASKCVAAFDEIVILCPVGSNSYKIASSVKIGLESIKEGKNWMAVRAAKPVTGLKIAGNGGDNDPTTFSFFSDNKIASLSIKRKELEDGYGSSFAIYVKGIDICSTLYSNSGFEASKTIKAMDLSNNAGWPDIHVPGDTVGVDLKTGRFKFSEGRQAKLKKVGSYGIDFGTPSQIKSDGKYAVISYGESTVSVQLYDIAKPEKPVRLSFLNLGWLYYADILDNLLITATKGTLVRLYDISDKTKPKMLWFNRRGERNSAVKLFKLKQKYYCYIGSKIWNLANTSKPVQAGAQTFGTLNLVSKTIGFFISRDGKSIVIAGLENPVKPKQKGIFKHTQRINAITFVEKQKLLICAANEGVCLVDLSDVSNPTLLTTWRQTFAGKPVGISYRGAVVKGKYLYVSATGLERPGSRYQTWGYRPFSADKKYFPAAGIKVLDISKPDKPVLAGDWISQLSQMKTAINFRGLSIYNKTLAVVDSRFGLRTFDISSPTQPKLVDGKKSGGEVDKIYVYNNIAYVCQNIGGGIWIIDVSNPKKPRKLKYYHTGYDMYGISGWRNKYIYFSGTISGAKYGRHILDVSNPLKPKEVFLEKGYETDYVAENNFLYTTSSVYNISSHAKPKVLAKISVKYSEGIAKRGNILCSTSRAGDTASSITLIDVSKPASPRLLPKVMLPYHLSVFGQYVQIRGNLALVSLANPRYQLAVINIANPQQPRLVGLIKNLLNGRNQMLVDVRGKYLYAMNYSPSLAVFDISNGIDSPRLVTKHKRRGDYAWTFQISGDYLYRCKLSELEIWRIPRDNETPRGKVEVKIFK